MPSLCFTEFDRLAQNGNLLNVVFMGGSLTWGANSTDPQIYSYRALLAQQFRSKYPHTPFQFWDAAIGGQGSQLGAFRLERDVLSRQPHLLFLEFAVNDDPSGQDEERLSSFEAIVRRVVGDAECPVLISILAVRDDLMENAPVRPRHEAHRQIAQAYHCPLALTIDPMRTRVRNGDISIDDLWANPHWPNPSDVTHPGNAGYRLFAEIIWQVYEEAVLRGTTCRCPETMLHVGTYLETVRSRLASRKSIPTGWKTGQPNRTSAAYDFLMSRWLDDLLIARMSDAGHFPQALTVDFYGEDVLLFGESTSLSGKYRVLVDGQPAAIPNAKDEEKIGVLNAATSASGNSPYVRVVVQGLGREKRHHLRIEPLLEPGQELRLESICVAGKHARVDV